MDRIVYYSICPVVGAAQLQSPPTKSEPTPTTVTLKQTADAISSYLSALSKGFKQKRDLSIQCGL